MTIEYYGLPASVCTGCRAVEISFRRWNIEATKIRLDQDAEALEFIQGLGYKTAPVIVQKEGDKIVDHFGGFQSEKIKALAG